MYHCVLRRSVGYILQQYIQHARVRDSRTEFCHRAVSLVQSALCRRLHNSKNNEHLMKKSV